jgi:hypothetical protein
MSSYLWCCAECTTGLLENEPFPAIEHVLPDFDTFDEAGIQTDYLTCGCCKAHMFAEFYRFAEVVF